MTCLKNLLKIIVARNYSPSSFKLKKEVPHLSWQNKYPNLKTTCHIKLKFLLRTKILENILIAKYLISIPDALTLVKSWLHMDIEINHCIKFDVLPDFLVWKFCGNVQSPQSFQQFTQNSAKTVRFPNFSLSGN